MKDYICEDRYTQTDWAVSTGTQPKGVRCWKRSKHEGTHLAVLPNRNQDVCTRPVVVRWGSPNLVAALG